MDSKEAQSQIAQMISFIASEASDKANEIQKKGEEEFSIEVHRLITEQKEKMRQGYEKKVKQIETQYAIAKSMAINKQRLEKIKARQEVMSKVENDVRPKLTAQAQDQGFITKLIVQGLLMLLEEKVTVRCRQADTRAVQACLGKAQSDYAALIKAETGATKAVTLVLDSTFLPEAPAPGKTGPSCLGGVMLLCQDGKISIDNTIDVRLKLVMEQAKPAIRGLLFPSA
uniref:V-type proton ATPase subunit E n=1 Tax=Zooxanthella nutricula TaxID=1333877 RepID=A0A7S2LKV9_9DINO